MDYLKHQLLEAFGSYWLELSIDDIDLFFPCRLASLTLMGQLELDYHGGVDILQRGIVGQLLKL